MASCGEKGASETRDRGDAQLNGRRGCPARLRGLLASDRVKGKCLASDGDGPAGSVAAVDALREALWGVQSRRQGLVVLTPGALSSAGQGSAGRRGRRRRAHLRQLPLIRGADAHEDADGVVRVLLKGPLLLQKGLHFSGKRPPLSLPTAAVKFRAYEHWKRARGLGHAGDVNRPFICRFGNGQFPRPNGHRSRLSPFLSTAKKRRRRNVRALTPSREDHQTQLSGL